MTFPAETSTIDTPMSVASFLRSKREEQGLTQQAVADRTGIHASTIKAYERQNGGSMPTIEKASLLADVLDFDPRDLFDEARGQSRQPKTDDETHSEPPPRAGRDDRGDLERIKSLVAERGLSARLLPGMVSRVQRRLGNLSYRSLCTLAGDVGIDPGGFPSEDDVHELGPDARDDACEDVQARLIVNALYGDDFALLKFDDLRALHKATARALGQQFPLPGVPARNLLGDLFKDPGDDDRLEGQIRYGLPVYLVEAVVEGRAMEFHLRNDEANWTRDQRIESDMYGEENVSAVFEPITKLRS